MTMPELGGGAATIRPAARADLPGLARLAADHAAYERAAPPPADLPDRLEPLLFGVAPRLHCLVAVDGRDELIGYLSCAPELSTWQGREYLHMDCLYLDEAARGAGVGRRLIDAAVALAADLGLGELQWNTPDWNVDAIRFYRRLGATEKPKLRFTLKG